MRQRKLEMRVTPEDAGLSEGRVALPAEPRRPQRSRLWLAVAALASGLALAGAGAGTAAAAHCGIYTLGSNSGESTLLTSKPQTTVSVGRGDFRA